MMKQTVAILLAMQLLPSQADSAETSLRVQHRRPTAAVLIDGGSRLCVANRRSGTLSLVNIAARSVSEKQIGQQLSDIVAMPGSDRLLVSDFAGGTVIVVKHSADGLQIVDRVDVAAFPESIAVNEKGNFVCVASLWSRRLTILSRAPSVSSEDVGLKKLHEIDLPFAPRAMAFVDSTRVVVADSFGGRLTVVDCVAGSKTAEHELPVHNVRDLTVGNDGRVYLTCQRLNPKGYADSEDIHWGILIENEILAIDIAVLIGGDGQRSLNPERISLGRPGEGAGDPGAVLVTPEKLVVTLAGTNELAIVDRDGVRESRVATGGRPLDVVHVEDTNRVFVVNSMSDSVSIVDLMGNRPVDTISLGPSPSLGMVERGEAAFFNATLSHESWMSCHSCHTDGHTNNGLADTLGDGDFGDAKRVPTLLGVWSTGPWAWNGSQNQLHGQIRKSLSSTMHASELDDDLITDLTAYVTKLERPPSVAVARGKGPHPTVEYKAREIFEAAGCATCHNGFTSYTTDDVFDVGLSDAHGNSHFNPPSLSGVSQRDRLFHDGRARSLEDVLIRFDHPSKDALSKRQRKVLIAFLRAL
ncbi:MAG: YVTN family beta-propeller protein [Planctomycetaceae bacterium]|jgi:YVTN family beta-propeller protein